MTFGIRRAIAMYVVAVTLAAAGAGHCRAELSGEGARTLLRNTTESWDLGDRVRVVSPEPYRVGTAGWFAGTEDDSLLLLCTARDLPPLSIRLYQIGALEEKAGSKRHGATGAVVGCAIGLVVGVVLERAHRTDAADDQFFEGLEQMYIPIGIAGGIVAGSMIGYMVTTDRWREVALFE